MGKLSLLLLFFWERPVRYVSDYVTLHYLCLFGRWDTLGTYVRRLHAGDWARDLR